jgi:hypothetical protein
MDAQHYIANDDVPQHGLELVSAFQLASVVLSPFGS